MNLQNNDLKNKLNFALANIEKNNLEKAAEIYKKILKKYNFPKPPQILLDDNMRLKIKIPVNFILR